MSVWGRIIRDEVVQEQDDASNTEEQCTICYNGFLSVRFKPCNHAACKNCVDDLRRSNIFKADAGVKCPYCRRYVENYEPLERGTALGENLNEANKAAKAAAAARHGPKMPSIQTVTAPQGVSQSATQERWKCPACGKANTGFRETCSSCSRPNPIAPASKETEGKDIMKCTPDEILALAVQKMHPSLDSAFREAGMPVEQTAAVSGNNLSVGGSDKTVQVAIQKNGLAKLKRIVKSLTSCSHIHTLLFHWFGNYTLQDLVAASSKLRTAAIAALHRAQRCPSSKLKRLLNAAFLPIQETGQGHAQMAVLHDVIDGKSDLLGALVMEVSKDAVEAALHKQGTYALQKVLESPCRDAEFVQLGQSLMENALQLVSGEPGIYVMAKLVDQLHKAAKRLPETTDARAAQLLLDKLCALYYDKKARYTDSQRYEKLRYDMLIAAIDGALPEHSSAMLALMLGQSAFEIQKKSPGRFLVKQLLKLQATKPSSVQVMQNVVCHVGESFEQNLVEIMLRPDDRPPHVVSVLMQELSTNEETDWVEHLVGEMVDCVGHLRQSADAMNIVKESLALPCLDEEFVEEQLGLLTGKVSNLPDFNSAVWRERAKKLKAKQAALADGAAVIGPSQAVDTPAAAQPASQAATPAGTPSKQQAEACKAAAVVPVSQMLSVQQVEAQQAAQQLLQGQQQLPLPAADDDDGAFGSVQMVAPTSSQHDSAHDTQVKPGSPSASNIRKAHTSGPLPSYIPPDEQGKLIQQARLNSAHPASVPQAVGSKTPPPGFPSLNGTAGSSVVRAGQAAPSPDRGRQTSGAPSYNPVPSSPKQAPQARHTPSQSPERASDPLAFLQAPPVAQSQAPRQRTTAAAGRKAVKAAFQPYQPPTEGLSLFSPPQQQAKVQKAARSPAAMSPRGSQTRPYVPYKPPADESVAAQPEAVIASVIAPAAREVQPPPSHPKPEQAYYRPPVDRHTVAPPRGADVANVIHASQQPLPRGDSDHIWGSEASLAAAHAPSRALGQVPFVQQQQNKQHPAASHAQKPQSSRAPAQQAQQLLHAGQAGSIREGREAARPEPTPAPAPEAASGWTCPTCTYRHEGKQAGFLACAMCGGVRKET